MPSRPRLPADPQWFRDAVIYELHVRAFADSNGDGIGDLKGLTGKLDYLQDLGVTAIWLLPFYASPLRDDGYDIADYTTIHPDYGTLRDFRELLAEAHRRGLRVITELVLNHTSDQHAWFQRARRAGPGSRWRDFYVWSDTPERYGETRVIFQDFESSNWSWDPVARAYYWHRFYSHQPDLNFDNRRVREAMLRVLDFWLEMGVDGLRLDAVPYLFERDGTNCENLPETHDFLRELRAHVDARFADRMLLAEANQWPEDAVAYFGAGDECHMCFHFPLMPRLFMGLRMEDRFPILDILDQTPAIPPVCQWGLFLRNHDELTLEMVTDEERDYMYRVYASDPRARINLGIRRRLAPLLGADRAKIELMNGFLLSLPGTPILYYGDEIGMGDNFYLGDRNGVRTPMQWSADRNAGFSRANPQRLYLPAIIDPAYHYESINVEAQQANPSSLLWWMRRLIALRQRYQAFGRGSLEVVPAGNNKVLAYLRRFGEERILVVANLSRFVQHANLELQGAEGLIPVELLGRTALPPVSATPYPLTLGPHAFFWLALEPAQAEAVVAGESAGAEPRLQAARWEEVLAGDARRDLEAALLRYLPERRWFGGKARTLRAARLRDALALDADAPLHLAIVDTDYLSGDSDAYLLPLAWVRGDRAAALAREAPQAVIARLTLGDEEGLVVDAFYDPALATAVLGAIARHRRLRGDPGSGIGAPAPALRHLLAGVGELTPAVARGEQSNSSVVLGQRLMLKLIRRLEPGVNPDLEVGRHLTERGFANTPPVAGALEYRRDGETSTLAVLTGFVANQGDAWQLTLDVLSQYFERVVARGEAPAELPVPTLETLGRDPHPLALEIIGPYLASAGLLGRRTGELHVALAAEDEDPAFAPEPFTTLYQRSLFQSMRTLTTRVFELLANRRRALPGHLQADVDRLLALEDEAHTRFRALLAGRISGMRTRIHGDYHLGQVLFTGADFVIIDFEGEPARPLSERRIKRSPLRDVAGMLRSYHYVTRAALIQQQARGLVTAEGQERVEPWARFFYLWVGAAFLRGYLDTTAGVPFLPASRGELVGLLRVYLLEKAVYELGYELNNRPDWVAIPLRGLLGLLGSGGV